MNNKKAVSPVHRLLREVKFHCRQRVKQVVHKFLPHRMDKPEPLVQLEFEWNKTVEPKQD